MSFRARAVRLKSTQACPRASYIYSYWGHVQQDRVVARRRRARRQLGHRIIYDGLALLYRRTVLDARLRELPAEGGHGFCFAAAATAIFERCSHGGRTCAMYSNSAYSEKASEQDLLSSLGFPSLIIKCWLAACKTLANKPAVGHSSSACRGARRARRGPVAGPGRPLDVGLGVRCACLKRLPPACMVQSVQTGSSHELHLIRAQNRH